jgi:hypothetical protein
MEEWEVTEQNLELDPMPDTVIFIIEFTQQK